MHIALSFDPLHLIGLLFCGYLASLLGNLVGALVVLPFTPTLDGGRFWKGLILANTALKLTIVKLLIAFVTAAIALALCDTVGSAFIWTTAVTGAIGFLFTLILGLTLEI